MKQKYVIFIAFIALFLAGVTLSLKLYKVGPNKTSVPAVISQAPINTPMPTVIPPKVIYLRAKLVKSSAAASPQLQVSLAPQTSFVPAAFDMRLILSSTPVGVTSVSPIAFDTQLKSDGWAFPIKKVIAKDSGLVLELSGVFMSPTNSSVSTDTPFFSLPLTLPANFQSLTVTVDNTVTKFLIKSQNDKEIETAKIVGPSTSLTLSNTK